MGGRFVPPYDFTLRSSDMSSPTRQTSLCSPSRALAPSGAGMLKVTMRGKAGTVYAASRIFMRRRNILCRPLVRQIGKRAASPVWRSGYTGC